MNFKLSYYLLVAILIVGCNAPQSSQNSARKVKCETVQSCPKETIEREYSGRIEAAKDVNLSFRIDGVVDRIVVKEGDFVRKGQVVALLDDSDYALQLSATEAEYDAIKGEVDRIVELHKQKSVADNDHEKAVNGLRRITAKLESHRNILSYTKLQAPFDGYVQKINFEKGEALSAGLPVASFISAGAPMISVDVPAEEYARRGDLISAMATSKSNGSKSFALKGNGVTQQANLNQLFRCNFVVEPADGAYPAVGTLAVVTLGYKSVGELITLPTSALVECDGASCVWLLVDQKATRRKVTVGDVMSCGRVVIEAGVAVGDVVITAGVQSLKEGQSVEPLAAESKSNVGNIL